MGTNKIIAITGVSCIVAGLGVGFVAYAASGFDKEVIIGSDDSEKVEFTEELEYTSIKIDVINEDVEFRVSEDGKTHIEAWDSDDIKHTVKVEDGQLTIVQKDHRKWYEMMYLNFSFITEDKDLIVELPYDEFIKLDIDSTSGDIDIPSFITAGELTVDTTSGDVTSEAVVTGSVDIDVTSGDIEVINADCDTISVDTTSGDVTVRNSSCNELSMDTPSGDVLVEDTTVAGVAELDTTSGDITIRRSTAASFDTDTTSGDVDYEN